MLIDKPRTGKKAGKDNTQRNAKYSETQESLKMKQMKNRLLTQCHAHAHHWLAVAQRCFPL